MKYLLFLSLILTGIACSVVPSSAPRQAWQMIDDGAYLIDVRSLDEYGAGHIEGAINIAYNEIESSMSLLPPDKDDSIVLYCRTGRRADMARQTLARIGYSNVFNAGGLNSLKEARQ